MAGTRDQARCSEFELSKLARVRVRFNKTASFIVNANHSIM
jgi:hypothetical protein